MTEKAPTGVISIGSNDIHLLVTASDGVGTFERQANQSMLAELVGAVKGGVVPASAVLMGGGADHLLQFSSGPGQHTLTRDGLHHTLHELHHKPAREIAHDYDCL